ncbi:MAG: hypothetical protein N3F07_03115 [Candidatus Micrarchaeota archaeon]|nr:hypothetical protein [Candidatus Micrarchaeota archaeon]
MLFDFSNYWIFLLALAIGYTAALSYLQSNIGGKNRLKNLQLEMREVQLKLSEAAKKKNEKEIDELISKNWKLTFELAKIQFQLFAVLIGILFALMYVFPFFEPGTSDDIRLPLFDDGLPEHCDKAEGDGIFSNCFALPQNGTRGAWIVDAYLLSATNETLARGSAPIYFEGGRLEDVWLQNYSHTSLLDALMGKKAYHVSVQTGQQHYSAGQLVPISAEVYPKMQKPKPILAENGGSHAQQSLPSPRLEASINMGTAFYIDLPFPLPLINISRISGSYGVFIFYAFVIGILLSIGRPVAAALRKKFEGIV